MAFILISFVEFIYKVTATSTNQTFFAHSLLYASRNLCTCTTTKVLGIRIPIIPKMKRFTSLDAFPLVVVGHNGKLQRRKYTLQA